MQLIAITTVSYTHYKEIQKSVANCVHVQLCMHEWLYAATTLLAIQL